MTELNQAAIAQLYETDEYQQVFDTLTSSQRESFRERVAELEAACSVRSIGEFLTKFLSSVHDLFAAEAVALWIRGPNGSVVQQSTVAWENLQFDDSHEAANAALIGSLLKANKASLVLFRPFSRHEDYEPANPTDSFVLMGPVQVDGENIAALQILLGPRPPRAKTASIRGSYLVFLGRVVQLLCRRLEREAILRRSTSQPTWEQILSSRDRLLDELQGLNEQIRANVESWLQSLEGVNRGSVEANRELLASIKEVLDRHGLKLACPTCGEPAVLRCQKAGNSKTGAFQFDHRVNNKRTFHGGAGHLPILKVC